MPADTAVTTPVLPTAAIAEDPLLHAPPPAVLINGADKPAHNVEGPLILPATGAKFTVTMCVAYTVSQVLLSV